MSTAMRWLLPNAVAVSGHGANVSDLPGRRARASVVLYRQPVPARIRVSTGRVLSNVVSNGPNANGLLRSERRLQSATTVLPADQLLLSTASSHLARLLQRPDRLHQLHRRPAVRQRHGVLQRRLLPHALLSFRRPSQQSLRPRRRLSRQLHLPRRSLLPPSSVPQRSTSSTHLFDTTRMRPGHGMRQRRLLSATDLPERSDGDSALPGCRLLLPTGTAVPELGVLSDAAVPERPDCADDLHRQLPMPTRFRVRERRLLSVANVQRRHTGHAALSERRRLSQQHAV